jgi:16S rRNA (adenine(1408)-N(1))-methyltransferase
MKIIKGNKKIEINKDQINELVLPFNNVVLDLGTGDGRYLFKNAIKNPDTFYIGVDPSEKSLEEYSKKAVKQKVNNVLFVVGSLEVFPIELEGIASEVVINLPWGTLLQAIAKPTQENSNQLKKIFKETGKLTIIFGYDNNLEPSETKRLNLSTITEKQIREEVIPAFENFGFTISIFSVVSSDELKNLESSWGKRIALRPERPLFMLIFLYG